MGDRGEVQEQGIISNIYEIINPTETLRGRGYFVKNFPLPSVLRGRGRFFARKGQIDNHGPPSPSKERGTGGEVHRKKRILLQKVDTDPENILLALFLKICYNRHKNRRDKRQRVGEAV